MGVTEAEVDALLEEIKEDPNRVLLSFGDSKILDHVSDLVRENLGAQDYVEFLRDLKQRLGQLEPSEAKDSLDLLHATVANCTICPKAINPSMPTWNRINPEVLIVSKLPITKDEGARLLVRSMKEAGLDSEIVGATAVARCTPEEDKHGKEVYGTCATNYLYKEISYMAPTVVLTLGSVPFFALFGRKEKVGDIVGHVRYLGATAVLPTYDPSYALRSPRREQDFLTHIQKIKPLLKSRHDE